MTTKNLEQRAQAAADEVNQFLVHYLLSETHKREVGSIILSHFADVGGNDKLREAAEAIRQACESNAAPMNLDFSLSQVESVEIYSGLLIDLFEALAQPAYDGRKEFPDDIVTLHIKSLNVLAADRLPTDQNAAETMQCAARHLAQLDKEKKELIAALQQCVRRIEFLNTGGMEEPDPTLTLARATLQSASQLERGKE